MAAFLSSIQRRGIDINRAEIPIFSLSDNYPQRQLGVI